MQTFSSTKACVGERFTWEPCVFHSFNKWQKHNIILGTYVAQISLKYLIFLLFSLADAMYVPSHRHSQLPNKCLQSHSVNLYFNLILLCVMVVSDYVLDIGKSRLCLESEAIYQVVASRCHQIGSKLTYSSYIHI